MRLSAFRVDRLLPAACLLAAGVLFASELMTMFNFNPPGGETLQTQSNHARHGNAMFVISSFAILLLVVAVVGGSKPAALGVAVMGAIALLWFLIGDLPDAGQVGTLNDVRQSYFDAEAVPQAGFWLEMVSAIGLAISGTALATLSPEQLMALRTRAGDERSPESAARPKPSARAARGTTQDPRSRGGEGESNPSNGSEGEKPGGSAGETTKKAPAPKGN